MDFSFSSDQMARCKIDLGLVVDLTGSIRIENVITMRNSLKYFTSKFVIGPDNSG